MTMGQPGGDPSASVNREFDDLWIRFAQLAGSVEVNFKSDYLPLDKMATPGMIAAIQGNSTPVDPNVVPSPRAAPEAQAPAPASPPAA